MRRAGVLLLLCAAADLGHAQERGRPAPEIPAEVLALRDAAVHAEVAGRVVERPDDDTGPVEKGALVVRLDDELVRAEAEAAGGRADEAEALRAWAETDLRRARDLLAAGSVEQARFDEAEAALHRATAAATAAEAGARLAEARLARTRIRAPFAGRLVHVDPELGEYLAPGMRAFRIVDDSALRVVGYVPADLVTRLAPGQRCRVVPAPREGQHGGGPGAADADAGASDRAPTLPELAATLFSVAPAAEGAARTFRVEARVAPEALAGPGARRWRPGMTAVLRFEEAR